MNIWGSKSSLNTSNLKSYSFTGRLVQVVCTMLEEQEERRSQDHQITRYSYTAAQSPSQHFFYIVNMLQCTVMSFQVLNILPAKANSFLSELYQNGHILPKELEQKVFSIRMNHSIKQFLNTFTCTLCLQLISEVNKENVIPNIQYITFR